MGGAPRHALLALALALSLNAAAAFKVPATAQDLTLYRIWDDAAVCNDGTPCAYARERSQRLWRASVVRNPELVRRRAQPGFTTCQRTTRPSRTCGSFTWRAASGAARLGLQRRAAADASRFRRCARCYNNVTCYARAQGAATLASSKAWDKATRVRDARSVAHAATRG